jgi:hypothetical protein
MITLSSKITSRRRPRGPGGRRVRRAQSSIPDSACRRAAGGVRFVSLARIPSSPPMINKPAVVATIPLTDRALLLPIGSSLEDHGEKGAAPR